MVGWYHRLNGHEFEQTPGDSEGQGSWVCCSPWGHKDGNITEQLYWTELTEDKKNNSYCSLFSSFLHGQHITSHFLQVLGCTLQTYRPLCLTSFKNWRKKPRVSKKDTNGQGDLACLKQGLGTKPYLVQWIAGHGGSLHSWEEGRLQVLGGFYVSWFIGYQGN